MTPCLNPLREIMFSAQEANILLSEEEAGRLRERKFPSEEEELPVVVSNEPGPLSITEHKKKQIS